MVSRVFITQIPSKLVGSTWCPSINVAPASEYGEIVVLMPPGHSQFMSAQLAHDVQEKLSDFAPESDYILPTGDPLIYTAVVAHLSHRFKKFRILKWDKVIRRYTSHMVII